MGIQKKYKQRGALTHNGHPPQKCYTTLGLLDDQLIGAFPLWAPEKSLKGEGEHANMAQWVVIQVLRVYVAVHAHNTYIINHN